MLKKHSLGDFLETAIVDFAIWLAMNYWAEFCPYDAGFDFWVDTFSAFRFFAGQNGMGTWRKQLSWVSPVI